MGWSNDPEMQKMFLDEVTERSARLVEGAQALRAGTVSQEEASDLLREGHTIKGTGRVMGYEDVGSAGLMLEMIWRWIQQGEITPVPLFGRLLEGLSAAIPGALDNPAELALAMTAVHEFFGGQELPEELPPVPAVEGLSTSPTAQAVGPAAPAGGPAIFGEPAPPGGAEIHSASPVGDASGDEMESKPAVSTHDIFAQLARAEAEDAPNGSAEAQSDGEAPVEVEPVPVVDGGPVGEQTSEPVMSAHEMFAQLASLEHGSEEAEPGVAPDSTTDVSEAVESAASDEPHAAEIEPSEPEMSAHEMFAQLVNEESQSAQVETSEDHSEEDTVAGPAPVSSTIEPVDGESASPPVGETSEDAARSAQEAFAELRRSMMQEAAAETGDAVETEAPAAAAGDKPVDRAADDEHLNEEAADVPTADSGVAGAEGQIGDVIAFPVAEGDGEGEEKVAEAADPGIDGSDEQPDAPDVVVLPANRKTQRQQSSEPSDLGGLVSAVQTWAAEEPISVNAGRLYGLVNHIVTLRMNIEMAKEQLAELAEVAAADPFFSDRVSGIAGEIEPVADASERIESEALALAAVPLRDVTNTLPQLGRYLSRKTGKELRVEIVGDDILVDRQVLDRLGDAIRQLVVNSAVHGIEDVDTRLGAGKPGTGSIRIEAKQTDVNLEVAVVDDGRGIDWQSIREKGLALGLLEPEGELAPEALRSLLYQSGFTTCEVADELAGDGDGLAVVRDAMESMNGSLSVESTPKMETRVSMIVPIHQAMQKALLVASGGITWGIPETAVLDVVEMNLATIAVADHSTVLERPDGDVPFASFADLMGQHSDAVPTSIVVAASAAGAIALGVEEVVGVRRIAAKELGAVLADAEADIVTGAALLGGEQVVLLVDTTRLAEKQRGATTESPAFPSARILIVDDSVGVQQVVSSALATSGFNTSVAASVADALGALHSGSIDAVVVDFSMPRADGVALAHMVRQRHGDLPIVMLSGVAEGEDVDRAREAGVDAFFDKSDFREGGLAEKLRELIADRRGKEQTA